VSPQPKKHNTARKPKIVLVAGFESFNRELYSQAARDLDVDLTVFADSDIRVALTTTTTTVRDAHDLAVNPDFASAVRQADAFIGSLIFDYDDVLAVQSVLPAVQGPRLVFESATELMTFNTVGSFSMAPSAEKGGGSAGPPPAVKAILSQFGSGKEEDKLSAYLKLLKVGPTLLRYVPGEKASDLRTWLEAYRYWNQGGKSNVQAMLALIADRCRDQPSAVLTALPPLQVTPDIGLIHPVRSRQQQQDETKAAIFTQPQYFESPAEYLAWRLSANTQTLAAQQGFVLAPDDAPRVAVLLYRKHVITEQRYLGDLIRQMEQDGLLPIPIFINGVEAHTIVRDLLTSNHEQKLVRDRKLRRDSTYQPSQAVSVDAIVNTIGFPLVGGPAGSMQAGRNVAVAETLLTNMNVPYVVASPLLLQSIAQWKTNGVLGLQSVVLYSLPELDGAIDTVVLGGLVGDKIALVPERVRKLNSRVKNWVELRRTPPSERRIAIALYGFPPNVGAVGTAALLDVPRSLDALLRRLEKEGYRVGDWTSDPNACGESLVAALATLCENPVITAGADRMQEAIESKIARATAGDSTVAATLALPGGGLGGAQVVAKDVSIDELEEMLGSYMMKKVRRAWSEKDRGPGVTKNGKFAVAGLQLGNVWIFVQPLLGVEGDPMRLLFERDLTPHPQYCATYEWLRRPKALDGLGTQALIHFGMHGTVEWLPGQPLGNDRKSWSDELLGGLPNLYVYAANNPSESILAKRRGYGTLVSYNVPPYGRSGLYLELANLKDLVEEYRSDEGSNGSNRELFETIYDLAQRSGMVNDVPLMCDSKNPFDIDCEQQSNVLESLPADVCSDWVVRLSDYLNVLQDRLFSSGLHVFGQSPSDEDLVSYLAAYFGEQLSESDCRDLVTKWRETSKQSEKSQNVFTSFFQFLEFVAFGETSSDPSFSEQSISERAMTIAGLLDRSSDELQSVVKGLDGGYIPPAPGGDLLRDGPSVLPTGRNIHALDPYRMPSAGAWARGQKAAQEVIRQHQENNEGRFPETIAVTLWGLDAIKTRGESVAIVLALLGAKPVKEGTGRIVRFDLIPLEELGRPRIDVLASLSGIFRDSFANIVDLLDDTFQRAAQADESDEKNFVKKHTKELIASGVKDGAAARLFSNPPGDYGSMVNEVIGTGDWEDEESLGETWKGRNVYSYGRKEGQSGTGGTARPAVLNKLLATTERVVQEIDSVEYGLSDIQEYYANTGALKKAAENRKEIDPKTGKKRKVSISVIEAFGGFDENAPVPVKDVEEVLRLEYRSKFLNPKWRDAMLKQGSGGTYEISQRMTAMIGWSATAEIDNFVFDQAAERYALDADVAKQLQRTNPEAFKNIVRRLLEASGRGMWSTDTSTLDKLKDLYADADDIIEQGSDFRAKIKQEA
jgi:magnesium chelatase subunit H